MTSAGLRERVASWTAAQSRSVYAMEPAARM